jgi:hypothetical protein
MPICTVAAKRSHLRRRISEAAHVRILKFRTEFPESFGALTENMRYSNAFFCFLDCVSIGTDHAITDRNNKNKTQSAGRNEWQGRRIKIP